MAMETDGASDTPIAEAGRAFQLRPGVPFLNHGSYGACPRPVFETYQRWQRELEGEPVEFLGRRLSGLLAEARTALAAYLGAGADDLVFVPNATYGMNIVARSLDLQPGDEVLGNDHEYGAVARTWRFLCGQHGAHYRPAPLTLPITTPDALIEQLWASVTERTRMLVVSHITSPTALTFPVAEICRRARAQGILTVIDGAHVPGQISLDLTAIGADFYTGNCHKWLCAPKGAAFLYARPERQHLLKPLVVSWGWEAREPGPSPFLDFFEWTGTHDPSAYLSVPAAIAFQAQHDWPRVRAACHNLLREARARIGALTDLPHISSDDSDAPWWAQMCAIPLPVRADLSADALRQRLWDADHIEVPITEWGDQRFVRVSIQAYNTPRDVDRLVRALSALL